MTAAGHFEKISEAVSGRIAEVLGGPVLVVDERGVVIASSNRGSVGLPIDLVVEPDTTGALRVPIRVDSHVGEVVVTRTAHSDEISPRLTQILVELMISQSTVVDRLANQPQLKSKFIHDLLHNPVGDEASILREGQMLGMDFTRPRAVILIDASKYILSSAGADEPEKNNAQIRPRSQLVIASVVRFFDLPDDTICAYIGNGEVAVLKASTSQDLVDWVHQDDRLIANTPSWANLSALKRAATGLLDGLRRETGAPISVGIGRYHPGIRGLASSYEDARAALSLGLQVQGHNQIHCLDGLGVAAFVGLADEQIKMDLATHLLSPLDHAEELLQTLSAFFNEHCCPSSTAKRLSIHRNTLGYRLDKIFSLTGLDPRRFDDAVQIRLALLLRSLRSEAG